MDAKEDCSSCLAMKKQLEELKAKHHMDFRTIKQKIVSTDELIKLYQTKCQEYDKQTKLVAQLTSRFATFQRNTHVIKLQLEKSVELTEPLQKKNNELQKKTQLQIAEMQKLRDRVKGAENLVKQIKNVVREKEKSEESLRLDLEIRRQEIDGHKKTLKRKEARLMKLKEELLAERHQTKKLTKNLMSSEKQIEESQQKINKLLDQLQDVEESGSAKKGDLKLDKCYLKEKVKFLSPPKHSRRTRRNSFLEQERNAKKTREELILELDEILASSSCPFLSPLPPSPVSTREMDSDSSGSSGGKDFINNCADYFGSGDYHDNDDDDSDGDDVGRNLLDDHSGNDIGEIGGKDLDDDGHFYRKGDDPTPLRTADADLLHATAKTDKASPLNSELATASLVPEGRSSACSVLPEETSHLMSLRPKRSRKRQRLSLSSEQNIIKTRKIIQAGDNTEQGSCKPIEIKISRNQSEDKQVEISNCTVDPVDVDALNQDQEDAITTPRQTEQGGRDIEDLEKEVSASLRNIVENVCLQESRCKNSFSSDCTPLFSDNTNTMNDTSGRCLKTNQDDVADDEREVLDCLNGVVEKVTNELHLYGIYTSESCNTLSGSRVDVKMNEITVSCESREDHEKHPVKVTGFTARQTLDVEAISKVRKGDEDFSYSSLLSDQLHDDGADSAAVAINMLKEEIMQDYAANVFIKSDENVKGTSQKSSATTDNLEKVFYEPKDEITNSCVDEFMAVSRHPYSLLSPLPDTLGRRVYPTELPSLEFGKSLPRLSPIPPSPEASPLTVDSENRTESDNATDEVHIQEYPQLFPPVPALSAVAVIATVPVVSEASTVCDTAVYNTRKRKTLSLRADGQTLSTDQEDGEAIAKAKRTSKAVRSRSKTSPATLRTQADPLDRLSNVSERNYAVSLLSKLKNCEVTVVEVTRRFLKMSNIRASVPLVSAIVEILKMTANHSTHALMKSFSEQYEDIVPTGQTDCNVLQPIMPELEIKITTVVGTLKSYKQFRGLLPCLLKLLGKTLCNLFDSDNGSTAHTICRMYTAVCRVVGDGGRIRLLCYDIIRQNRRHQLTKELIWSVGLVWPEVLRKDRHSVDSVPRTIKHSTQFQPFLSTLHAIIMFRETSPDIDAPTKLFQRFWGWSDNSSGTETLERLASDLVITLQDPSYATLHSNPEYGPSMASGAFETVKCLELLAVVLGWQWTNDVLIRDLLWPVLQQWRVKGFSGELEAPGAHNVINHSSEINPDSAQTTELVTCDRQFEAVNADGNIYSFALACERERSIAQKGVELAKDVHQPEVGVDRMRKDTDIDTNLGDEFVDLKIGHRCSEPEVKGDLQTGNINDEANSLSQDGKKVSACISLSEMGVPGVSENDNNALVNEEKISKLVRTVGVAEKTFHRTANLCDEEFTDENQVIESDKRAGSVGGGLEATIVCILRLIGLLGEVALQQEGVIDDAVINLFCAVMSSQLDDERVTFGIQLAAVYASVDVINASYARISEILDDWTTRTENAKKNPLPPYLIRKLKAIRTRSSKKTS